MKEVQNSNGINKDRSHNDVASFKKRIGKTEYIIGFNFKDESKSNFENKLIKAFTSEIESQNFDLSA